MAFALADKPSICAVQAVTWSSGWVCSTEMRARSLDQRGVAWIRADGSRRADMPVTAFNGNGLVSKLEILRGDLVDVLYQATKDHTEYRFNTRIEDLSQNADSGRGNAERRNNRSLPISSSVATDRIQRCAAWCSAPEEQFVKPLGGYNAWFTAPDTVGLDGWYLMYQAPGLNASMRPSHDPAMCKAGLAFRSEPVAYDRRNTDEQRALLATHFAGAGWQCDALLSAAARPTTSTSTRSPRCTCRRSRRAASRSRVTPDTAPHR